MKPLVSVVICVYNAGNYLRPSLLSVLQQTYSNLDIVIVDDGSTDGCFDTVQDLLTDNRIRLFRQDNATKPVALNRALDNLKGEFYAVHDADDISHPKRIEKELQALLSDPRLAAVFCGNELIIDGKCMAPVFPTKSEAECKRAIDAFRMPAHDPTGMYRMSLVGHLRYDVSLPIAESIDYILRIGEGHPMIVLGKSLYKYRILPSSLSTRDPTQRERLTAKALMQACARRGLDPALTIWNRQPGSPRLKTRTTDRRTQRNIATHFIDSVLDQCRAGRRPAAFKTAWQCICLRPFDPHYYKPLLCSLTSPAIIEFIRRNKRYLECRRQR